MTTKEVFEYYADDIIFELETFWSVQRGLTGECDFVNVPFPKLKDFVERYETSIESFDGIDEPVTDYHLYTDDMEKDVIAEQIKRIKREWFLVENRRNKFLQDRRKKR